MEEWKDIVGYEGYYQVSSDGNVRSLNRTVHHSKNSGTRILFGRMIKNHKNTKGYISVALSKNGVVAMYRVHRLVAKMFVPNPNNLPEINHIDENKSNNASSNLEWVSHLNNIRHGTGIRRGADKRFGSVHHYGESHAYAKLTNHDVVTIYKSSLLGRELSKIYNVSESCISEIKNKKSWKHLLINL